MVIETKKTHSAGGVVLNQTGEVLIVSQKGTSWSLPKGHIEAGEDALTAAKREILEETGISELELVRELGSYERYKRARDGGEDTSELKKLTLYLFRTPQTHLKPIDPDNPEALWVSKEKAAELLTHPKDREFFVKVMKDLA